jgi:hypothetical protein
MTSFQSIKANAPLSISLAPVSVEHGIMSDSAINVEPEVKVEPVVKSNFEQIQAPVKIEPLKREPPLQIAEESDEANKSFKHQNKEREENIWKGTNPGKKFTKSYSELKKHVDRNSDLFSRNKQGELVISGNPIPNSNFSALVSSLYSKSDQNLLGRTQFLTALKSISLPPTAISNRFSRALYTRLQEGQGKSQYKSLHCPPGKPVSILRVYR